MILYNEYEAMTKDALNFTDEVEHRIESLVDDLLDQGAKGREITCLLHTTIEAMIAPKVLRRAMQKRKEKQCP
jgi:archaellum component FlaC